MKEAKPTSIRVRYAETDQMGVVYHANYLIYFDIARTDWIAQVWQPYSALENEGQYMVVVDAQLNFKSSAHFDDILSITVRPRKLSRIRLMFEYVIELESGEQKLICSGSTSHCLVDSDGKPQRMPESFFNLFR
jgi:acyl-CoA thioester hydrolase